jgi:hypothetical protein
VKDLELILYPLDMLVAQGSRVSIILLVSSSAFGSGMKSSVEARSYKFLRVIALEARDDDRGSVLSARQPHLGGLCDHWPEMP